MTSRVHPSQLEVHSELEAARPLSEDTFREIKDIARENGKTAEDVLNGDVPLDLDDDEREHFQSVIDIARDLEENDQLHPVIVNHSDVTPKIVSGYTRYLACLWSGRKVETKPTSLSDDEDVNSLIIRENENREGLDPERRAEVIAKAMGAWDYENDEYVPLSEAEDLNMTLTEFANEVGKNKGLIWQFLSPLRQSKEMREDFGDELQESALKTIEKVTDDDADQYAMAQALVESDVDTVSAFQEIVNEVRNRDDISDVPEAICNRLTGNESAGSEPEELDDEDAKSDVERIIEEKRKERRQEQEENEVTGRLEQRKEEIESQSTTSSTDSTTSSSSSTSSTATTESTTSTTSESTANESSTTLSVTIEDEDLVECIREQAESRNASPDETVEKIIRNHYRDIGKLDQTARLG